MRSILVVLLILGFSGFTLAQNIQKWIDENGVVHITDGVGDGRTEQSDEKHSLPGRSSEIRKGTGQEATPSSRQEQTVIIYQQSLPQPVVVFQQPQPATQQVDIEDINRQIESLRQDIRRLESQKRMDVSMEPPGLRSEIKRKEEMISELMMMKSGQSGREAMQYRNDKRAVQALERIEANTRSQRVIYR